MPNDASAGVLLMGTRLVASLDDLGEYDFSTVWAHSLSDAQKASIPPEDCERFRERYRKTNPQLGKSITIVDRVQAKMDAMAQRHHGIDWPAPLDLEARRKGSLSRRLSSSTTGCQSATRRFWLVTAASASQASR